MSQSPPPAPSITVNKVVAGAGAAVTAAVLGSFFGVAGTVVGAAIGSVASTIANAVYERSLDRTRERIVARLRAGSSGELGEDEPDATDGPAPRRPNWGRWAGATVLVFLLGMLVVTGVEWVKGSTVAGEPGTSVGRVLAPSASGATDTPSPPSSSERSTAARATRNASRSPAASATPAATAEPSATPRPAASATPTPSAAPAAPAAPAG